MSGLADPRSRLTVTELTGCDDALAAQLAAVTAAAFRYGDLAARLPVADGAGETASSVRADLDRGRRMWLARIDGVLAGTVRASAPTADTWQIHRLAVAPGLRRSGVARALVRQLEQAARTSGASQVRLNAVVERGHPAVYARLGYRTTCHFTAPDKLLSEVGMVRDITEPAGPVTYPDDGEPPQGLTVLWRAVPGGTECAVAVAGSGLARERMLGLDCWPDALLGAGQAVEQVCSALGSHVGGRPVRHATPALEIGEYVQPRLVHPGLLAWWRQPAPIR